MAVAGPSSAELLFDVIKGNPAPGRLISYEEIEERIGYDIRKNRSPYYSAKRKAEKELRRTLAPVPGEGYRIIHPNETAAIGQQRIRAGNKQFRRGSHTVECADYAMMTPEERRKNDSMAAALDALQQEVRSLNRRLKRNEDLAQAVARKVDVIDAERLSAEDIALLRAEADRIRRGQDED